MDPAGFGILLLGALAAGFLASMIGIGGGVMLVPLLVLGGFAPTTQVAVGTSLAAVAFTSLSASIQYARKGTTDFRLGLLLMPGLVVGVEAGARITTLIASSTLTLVFAVFLVYPAMLMVTGRRPGDLFRGRAPSLDEGKSAEAAGRRPVVRALLVGLFAGVASGLLGIGGGAVMVPAMVLVLHVPMLTAVATSLFAFGPTTLFGAWRHYAFGNLQPDLALPLVLGTLSGAFLGPLLAVRVPQARLRQGMGGLLLVAALQMVLRAL